MKTTTFWTFKARRKFKMKMKVLNNQKSQVLMILLMCQIQFPHQKRVDHLKRMLKSRKLPLKLHCKNQFPWSLLSAWLSRRRRKLQTLRDKEILILKHKLLLLRLQEDSVIIKILCLLLMKKSLT